jgi:hypothetical protein
VTRIDGKRRFELVSPTEDPHGKFFKNTCGWLVFLGDPLNINQVSLSAGTEGHQPASSKTGLAELGGEQHKPRNKYGSWYSIGIVLIHYGDTQLPKPRKTNKRYRVCILALCRCGHCPLAGRPQAPYVLHLFAYVCLSHVFL